MCSTAYKHSAGLSGMEPKKNSRQLAPPSLRSGGVPGCKESHLHQHHRAKNPRDDLHLAHGTPQICQLSSGHSRGGLTHSSCLAGPAPGSAATATIAAALLAAVPRGPCRTIDIHCRRLWLLILRATEPLTNVASSATSTVVMTSEEAVAAAAAAL